MRKISSVLLLLIFATSSVVFSADKIIFFDKSTDAAQREESVQKLGGTVTRDMPEIFAAVVSMPATKSSAFTISSAKSLDPKIVDAEDNRFFKWIEQEFDTSLKRVTYTPKNTVSVPEITTNVSSEEVKGQQTPWGIGRVESNAAWKRGYTGKGVVVAVVDTGIKLNHPDLKANIIGNYNAIETSKPANDGNGHGTHVAGTIAALNNKIGVVGIAYDAKLLAVKVLDDSGSGSFDSVAAGVIWAANNGAHVINMSLSSPYLSKAVEEAVNYAVSKNVTIVCAAGNQSGHVRYPAAMANTIAVSASDRDSKIARFSNTGKEITFIAPGVEILSAHVKTEYRVSNGTSMASPHIAGLAALAVQAGAKTPDQVLAALKKAARPLKDLTKEQQGNGFVKGRWIGEK